MKKMKIAIIITRQMITSSVTEMIAVYTILRLRLGLKFFDFTDIWEKRARNIYISVILKAYLY